MRSASVFVPRSTRKRVHRAGRAADGVLEEGQLRAQRRVVADQRAADDVGVAAEVLRQRVQHEVRAELERPLQERRRERVVDDDELAARVRDLRRTAAMSVMRSSGLVGVSR